MGSVLCLGCVRAILGGLVQTVTFVKRDWIVNMADVLMSLLNANATANTMDQLVINQCVLRAVIQSMVIAMYLNNVGASLAGLGRTALFVNPTGVVSTELAMTIPGSASVRKDGWDLTAIAQKILMAIGANGVNGVIVPALVPQFGMAMVNGMNGVSVLAVLPIESAPDHVTIQPQREMELTVPMMEVLATNLKSVT